MKVIWGRRATADKEAIWQFLANRDSNYADRVEQRLEQRAESLSTVAGQGRHVASDDRRMSVPDIQYVLHYRIEDDVIRILRVRSTRQDPTR